MTWLASIEPFLVAHKDSLGLLISAVGAAAIFVAASQLGEAQRQRGIAESLQLFAQLDQQLSAWSASATDPIDQRALAIALGRLLSTYEIAADGINRSFLSKMASEFVVSHMRSSLLMVMNNEASRAATLAIAQNARVYASIKILLLSDVRKLVASDRDVHIRNTFFVNQPQTLFASNLTGWLRRQQLKRSLR